MTLQYLFAIRGAPEHLCSDNGPEFVAKEIQEWLKQSAVGTLYIRKASPWENGYVESFNVQLREELLNRELFLSATEARMLLDQGRIDYNQRRPHGSPARQTPAAFAAQTESLPTELFPSASRAESPLRATPIAPTQHAEHSAILS